MSKIVITGSPGAGKSTLTLKLGKKLYIPVYHLDKLLYKPGWVRVSKEEWVKIQADLVKKDHWIIDGNYQGSLSVRLKAADVIILLNYPKLLCLDRAIKRLWIYFKKRLTRSLSLAKIVK